MHKKRKNKKAVENTSPNQNKCMNPKSITFTFDPEVTAVVTLEDGTEVTLNSGVSPVAPTIKEIDVPFTDGTVKTFVEKV